MVVVVSVVVGRAHAQSGNASVLAEQLFNQARDFANQQAEAYLKFPTALSCG